MIKKAFGFAGVLTAAAILSAPAFAQVSPAPVSTTLRGSLALEQSTPLNCDATFNLTIDAGGTTGNITGGSIDPGDWQCFLVNPTGFNWPITIDSAGNVTISNVGASSILGSCSGGVLTGTFANPGVITITGVINGTPGPCNVAGQLVSDTPLNL